VHEIPLTIIVPCYNESQRIHHFFEQLQQLPPEHFLSTQCEWLFVDDGSNDDTAAVLKGLASKVPTPLKVRVIEQNPNAGKGAAVRRGDLEASGNMRVFLDADLSTPLHEIEAAFKRITQKQADLLLGSRHAIDSVLKEKQPWHRVFLGRCFSYFCSLFHANAFSDTQCGFKMWTKKFSEEVVQKYTENRWAFDIEMILLAEKKSLLILEHPVEWQDCEGSKVSALKDGIKMLGKTVLFRARHGSWLVWGLAALVLIASFSQALRWSNDMQTYAIAWGKILQGNVSIYELGRSSQGGYYYSPFFAVFFAPLAFLEGNILRAFYALLTLAIALAGWVLLKRLLRISETRLNGAALGWVLFILIMSNSLVGQFQSGNVSLWVLSFCLFSFYAWLYRDKKQSALWLALAVNIKVFPLFLLIYFVWQKDFKFMLYFVFWSAVLLLLPALFVGFQNNIQMHLDQIHMLKLYGPQNDFGREAYQNISAALIRLNRNSSLFFSVFGSFSDNVIVQFCQGGVALLTGGLLLRMKQDSYKDLTLAFALVAAMMGQFTPTSWINHMGFCYFPILGYLLFNVILRKDSSAAIRFTSIMGIAFFSLSAQGVVGRQLNDWLEVWNIPTIGIWLLIVSFWYQTKRHAFEYSARSETLSP